MSEWRVGNKVPINVYDGDRPVCQCHNEEDARYIVAAVNAAIADEKMFERAENEPLTDLEAPIAVEFDREEDGRWIADIPEAPGCMAYGATKDEAKDAAIAIFKAQKAPH